MARTSRFEAIPLVSGPLPTPMPTPSPAPQSVTDAPCGLLDAAVAAETLRLDPATLLLLEAGPGQCVGITGNEEVVFLSIRDDALFLELDGVAPFRGATCAPLARPTVADGSVAAFCRWPDGRPMVVANVVEGSVSLVVALTSASRSPEELLQGVTALLASGLERLS